MVMGNGAGILVILDLVALLVTNIFKSTFFSANSPEKDLRFLWKSPKLKNFKTNELISLKEISFLGERVELFQKKSLVGLH